MAGKQPIISAEDLKDVLECPVCLRIPRSAPVYQCERGHVVCNECHPKLATCPVCRLPLGKTRSLISEKVLAKMPSACKYFEQNCAIELMKADLEVHEKECLFRLVHCVDLACHQRVPFVKLLDHMANDHEREDFVNADGSHYRSHFIVHEEDFAREIMWISDHLHLDGRHFFRECCRNSNGLWYIWVYLLGTPKEAEQYVYQIKITSEDKEEELAYRGRVVSLDIPKEKLTTRGSGLIFPDATARQFWTNLKIHYSVAVSTKKSRTSDHHKKKQQHESSKENSSTTSTKQSKKSHEKGVSAETKKEKVKEETSSSGTSTGATATTTTTANTIPTSASSTTVAVPTSLPLTSTNSEVEDVRETPC